MIISGTTLLRNDKLFPNSFYIRENDELKEVSIIEDDEKFFGLKYVEKMTNFRRVTEVEIRDFFVVRSIYNFKLNSDYAKGKALEILKETTKQINEIKGKKLDSFYELDLIKRISKEESKSKEFFAKIFNVNGSYVYLNKDGSFYEEWAGKELNEENSKLDTKKYTLKDGEKEIIKEIVSSEDETISKDRLNYLLRVVFFMGKFEFFKSIDIKNLNGLYGMFYLSKETKKFRKYYFEKKAEVDQLMNIKQMSLNFYQIFIKHIGVIKTLDMVSTEDLSYFLENHINREGRLKIFDESKSIKGLERKYARLMKRIFEIKEYNSKEKICEALRFEETKKMLIDGVSKNKVLKELKRLITQETLEKKEKERLEEIKKEELRKKRELETKKRNEDFLNGLNKLGLSAEELEKMNSTLRFSRDNSYGQIINNKIGSFYNQKTTSSNEFIEKLKDSKVFKITNDQMEVSTAGVKAKCCLHLGGLLKELVKFIHENPQMAIIYGEVNQKNYQILVYKKTTTTKKYLRQTIVLDNLEASTKLTIEEFKPIINEIKRVFPLHSIELGTGRTDIENINDLGEQKRNKNRGLMSGDNWFSDSYQVIKLYRGKNTEVPLQKLFIRNYDKIDLLQISTLEENLWGEYDNDKIFINKALNDKVKIKVITDEYGNIFGYAIISQVSMIGEENERKKINISIRYPWINNFIQEQKISQNVKTVEYIEDIFVAPEIRGKKIMLEFFKEITKELDKKVFLHTNKSSEKTVRFLIKQGLEVIDLTGEDKERVRRIK